jgi:hypothetical protein
LNVAIRTVHVAISNGFMTNIKLSQSRWCTWFAVGVFQFRTGMAWQCKLSGTLLSKVT